MQGCWTFCVWIPQIIPMACDSQPDGQSYTAILCLSKSKLTQSLHLPRLWRTPTSCCWSNACHPRSAGCEHHPLDTTYHRMARRHILHKTKRPKQGLYVCLRYSGPAFYFQSDKSYRQVSHDSTFHKEWIDTTPPDNHHHQSDPGPLTKRAVCSWWYQSTFLSRWRC